MRLTTASWKRSIQYVDADTSHIEAYKASTPRSKKDLTVSAGELSLYGLFSSKYRSLINKAVGAVFAANEKRYALTDNPARELTGGISGTRQTTDVRVAHDTSALEIEASHSVNNSIVKAFLITIWLKTLTVYQELGLSIARIKDSYALQ